MSNNNQENIGVYYSGWCYLGFILPHMSMNRESLFLPVQFEVWGSQMFHPDSGLTWTEVAFVS